MAVELFADRFLRDEQGRWVDLATSATVNILIEPWAPDVDDARREDLGVIDAIGVRGEPESDLVDCGRVGNDLWFEARAVSTRRPVLSPAVAEAIQSRARHVGAVAEAAACGIRIARALAPQPGTELVLGSEIGARLRRMGIVPVRAGLALPPAAIVALSRRHLAVFCYDEAGETSAADWVRRLSLQTLRGHLVVDVRSPGARTRRLADAVRASELVRERGPWLSTGRSVIARVGDAQLDRAMSCLKRGRQASGERWLRAAVESKRRRNDEEGQARAGRHLAECLVMRDDWRTATALVLDQLGRFKSWHARIEAGDVASRVLTLQGELQRADGLLGGLRAEAAVLGQMIPPALRLREAELRFWQGRFEEARAVAGAVDAPSPEAELWVTLVAWACGEEEASSLARFSAPIGEWLREPIVRACTAEALLADGRRDEAFAQLGPRRAQQGGSVLENALIDWLWSKCAPDPAESSPAGAAARQFIQRARAHGITRWGLGRRGMHLLHAIPALLHIVHDAPDDVATLAQGTAWLRSYAGAESAAILTHDGGRIIAGERFDVRDLEHELVRDAVRAACPRTVACGPEVVVASPIAQAAATIGIVIARGSSATAGTLAEAAGAVASLCAPALRARLDSLATVEAGRSLVSEILGRSPAIQALREGIARAAATSFPVLIEGESGTGKELVARAVHRLSARRDRRFCAINCAALTDELVEAELFGHARGAFTGAVGPRAGLFEEAHHGTLFLDEIGELSARAQAKLLRVLQEREIRRVGENLSRPVDVRVVAATNRTLSDAAGDGLFRDDLRFRLAVVRFRVPPLRDRLEDVPLLADAFWRQATAEVRKRVVLGPDAVVALCRHQWPGNVRELQNAIAALSVIAPSRGRVSARHVHHVLSGDVAPVEAAGASLDSARRSFERRLVAAALVRHAGRRAEAARELGLSRQGLVKAIKRLGVDVGPDAQGVA